MPKVNAKTFHVNWQIDNAAYPDGRMRFVDPAATEIVGITPEEMKESMEGADTAWWTPFIHPDDRERSLALWRNSLKTGEPLIDEQRVRCFDGTCSWFRDTAIAYRDENGKITVWHGSTVDVPDQTNAEAALKASEQQLPKLNTRVLSPSPAHPISQGFLRPERLLWRR